jgi:nonsense-mediated mRNA decay protein 3
LFCVECGKEGELIGPLCPECHSKKHVRASLPEFVDVTLCAHCSALQVEDRWEEVGSVKEAVEQSVTRAVVVPKDVSVDDLQVLLTEKDERTFETRVEMSLRSQGHVFGRIVSTTVRLKRGACKECSKQKGSYFEAILQLRGDERVLNRDNEDEVRQQVLDRVDAMRADSREVFVSKVERVRGGLDFYFSTAPAARIVARELQDQRCAEYKESTSLWGRREGREVFRVTFLVRFPSFGPGDIITFRSKDWYVKSMSKGLVRCIDLASGDEQQVRLREMEECIVSCAAADIRSAVVLMESDSEVQVLDPVSMSPIDLRKPRGFSREGEQVRIVKTNIGTYALSDSW